MADKERDYTEVVVKVGKSFVMAYTPQGYYLHAGDEVELENGNRGLVLMEDRYVSYDSLCEIERKVGEEFVKVKAVFRKEEVKWEEE